MRRRSFLVGLITLLLGDRLARGVERGGEREEATPDRATWSCVDPRKKDAYVAHYYDFVPQPTGPVWVRATAADPHAAERWAALHPDDHIFYANDG